MTIIHQESVNLSIGYSMHGLSVQIKNKLENKY